MIDNEPDLSLLFKLALESAGLFYSKLTHLITLCNALFNCISVSYDLVIVCSAIDIDLVSLNMTIMNH